MPSHSLWAREEPVERAIFVGSHQHAAAECLGLYLFSGLHAVDCRFPKTEFFETRESLRSCFVFAVFSFPMHVAEVMGTVSRWWQGCCCLPSPPVLQVSVPGVQ